MTFRIKPLAIACYKPQFANTHLLPLALTAVKNVVSKPLKTTLTPVSVLSAMVFSHVAFAQIDSTQPELDLTPKRAEIERIQVTGSRIQRLDLEGVNPVVVLSAEDMERQGFSTVYEALQNFAGANGDNRGQAMSGTARNAETMNLRGLGPNRTLFLLNGKRVANYPRVLDGNYNVFNIASIATAAVDRVEIVTTGSSSIYGSDAMAGVVNIITKQGVESTSITARTSQTGHGDGNNHRLSVVTGDSNALSNWTLALEYSKQDMLIGKQRDWLDNRFDTPADLASQSEFRTALPRGLAVFHMPPGADDFAALDPGQAVCDQFDQLTYTNISFFGYYCGRDNTGDSALIHGRENLSAYFSGNHQFSSPHTLSADLVVWHSDAQRVDGKEWSTDYLKHDVIQGPNSLGDGLFFADDGTSYMLMREFQKQELLGGKGQEQSFDETMVNLSVTLSGQLSDDVDYEFYLNHSLAQTRQSSYEIKTEAASDHFVSINPLDQSLSVDLDKWWQPLSEQDFHHIFGLDVSKSDSYVTSTGLTLTGSLFAIEDRSVDFAAFTEFETSHYDLNESPRTLGLEGEGWVNKSGTVGSGDRNRYAFGMELSLPLAENLTTSLSARYDRYLDNTQVEGAPTYKFGFEWHPVEAVLVRASHGTIFRAPDLHNVFKGRSTGPAYINDYALIESCEAYQQGRVADVLVGADNLAVLGQVCSSVDFSGSYRATNISSGNIALKEETGYSNNVGLVWSPNDNTSLSFDLFNIKLKDQVTPDSVYDININEWQCLKGELNLASELCQHTLGQVKRHQNLGQKSLRISEVTTSFVNTAMQETKGFDMALYWQFDVAKMGAVTVKSNYTHIFETQRQDTENGEINKEYREDYYNSAFRSKISSVLEWSMNKWSASLTHTRYGSQWNLVRNSDYTRLDRKRYAPLSFYNLAVGYQVLPQHNLRLGIVNLFDTRARYDASQQHYPYFKTWSYPQTTVVMGRQFSLTYQLDL